MKKPFSTMPRLWLSLHHTRARVAVRDVREVDVRARVGLHLVDAERPEALGEVLV
jgi:hypothetical protein